MLRGGTELLSVSVRVVCALMGQDQNVCAHTSQECLSMCKRYCIGNVEVGEHSVVVELEEVMLSTWESFRDNGTIDDSWILKGNARAVEPFRRYYNQLRDQGVCPAATI